MDLFPHDLSMILSLADTQPDTGALTRAELRTPGAQEPAVMRLGFAGGLTTMSRASNTSPTRERTLALRCDAGLLVFDDIQPWARKLAFLEGDRPEPRYIDLPEREPLADELRHFVEGIAGAPVTRGTAEEGLRVLRTIALCARREAKPLGPRRPIPVAERRVG
jgi:predicted dehydrogenase